MQWLRLYHEARVDAKLRSLTDAQFRVWFNLLCLASEQPVRGTITDHSDELLAIYVAGGDVALLESTLDRLVSLKIVRQGVASVPGVSPVSGVSSVSSPRFIAFQNYEKRQRMGVSRNKKTSTDRVRKYRERKKMGRNGTLKRDETLVQHACNSRATDSDSETDTEKPPLPPVSGGAGGAGGGGDISTFEELLIRVEADFRRPDWTAAVRSSERAIMSKVDRLDCFLAGLRQADRSRTDIYDLIGFAIDRARTYQRTGIPAEPVRVEPKASRPADRATPPPLPGKAESEGCVHCEGTGMVRVFHPDPKAARQPASTGADCTCPLGRSMRATRKGDDAKRIPDLADVLAGRGPWRLDEQEARP